MSSISATRSPEAIRQCMAGEKFQDALFGAEAAKQSAVISAGLTGIGLTVGGPTTAVLGASGLVVSGIAYFRSRNQMEAACGPESLKMPTEYAPPKEALPFGD